jgi:3-hydroxybutyryl-CoA dehydrogenase
MWTELMRYVDDRRRQAGFSMAAKLRAVNESSILVVGAGTMGAGIAYVAAKAGYTVQLVDPDAGARERGCAQIAKDAERGGDPSVASRVTLSDALPQLSDAWLAIEAVPERLELKSAIFTQFEKTLDHGAILATNTSSLHVGDIAEGLERPQHVLGLHFFNPPAAMKLVEIVTTDQTSDDTFERARAFVERTGKTGVETADTPGFIVNRVARPFYLQAMRALEREVASIEELDALARAAGFRMGPFELMDLIGIDVNLAVSESIFAQLDVERLEPRPVQRELIAAGRLGRKASSGFYAYANGQHARLELQPRNGEDQLDEFAVVVGFGGIADELAGVLQQRCTHVQRIENDEMLNALDPQATIVIDVGDGSSDRRDVILELDRVLAAEAIIFVDAYATDIRALAAHAQHAERVVGYGIIGDLEDQSAVELVDADATGDDALAVAQEVFEAAGKAVVLVEDRPGLFLGRTIGSIVNEAMIAVADDVATPDDIDLAMQLGVNYPRGPIAWGRTIGGARIARILSRLAEAEGESFGPHRSLWVLDADEENVDPEMSAAPAAPLGE